MAKKYETVADIIADRDALRSDAERYRWLIDRLQKAYDGNDLEIGDMIVGCSMIYARRNERRVSGAIHWSDERDAPLNLSEAIDAAMAVSSNGQVEAPAESRSPRTPC